MKKSKLKILGKTLLGISTGLSFIILLFFFAIGGNIIFAPDKIDAEKYVVTVSVLGLFLVPQLFWMGINFMTNPRFLLNTKELREEAQKIEQEKRKLAKEKREFAEFILTQPIKK